MSTHVAIATTAKGVINTIQVPTEEPGSEEVLIKVEYAAMIPPDAYIADRGFLVSSYPLTLGFTAAGTVAKVGSGVEDLKPGDRKGVQEYCIQPRGVCAKISGNLSFEAAATIPDNFVCAFYTVFNQLSLPVPESFPASVNPPLANTPILIYGAGSTSGQYMIRLLHLARYTKIFATASSKHHDYLRSLGATDLFDYNSPTLVDDINKAAGGPGKLSLAVDCISAASTMGILAKILSPTGSVGLLLPVKKGTTLNNGTEDELFLDLPFPESLNPFQKGTNIIGVRTFLYQADQVLKEKLMPVILPELLEKDLIQPTRLRLFDQGSLQQRVEQALDLFRSNKVSGEKLVIKIN
ncbi:GroES-like protein [Macrolepiota fuliginosa MF-IS2]|uniref:GroES-like protein n=1 Tax=Macrolepiota fuliginosa MF-IS2 TaxID=1400762 RepID=A0A9P5XCI9_9AGAR|nr:GroES-like protein [Macrolepiota fuliginosa MF-IS2]